MEDLLSYSRAGKVELSIAPVPLDEVVQAVTRTLVQEPNPPLPVSHVSLPVIMANRGLLHQLLQNLLENAMKYARPDVPLEISLKTDETPTHWNIRVIDNGIGIAPDFQERIFEPFQRVTNNADPTSSGIGLAICWRIAERHGGTIVVTSEVGKGSTFEVSIRKRLTTPP